MEYGMRKKVSIVTRSGEEDRTDLSQNNYY